MIGRGRLNQVFLLTCIASFVLQLFGSILSWTNGETTPLRRLALSEGVGNQKNVLHMSDGQVAEQTFLEGQDLLPQNMQFGQPKHSGRLRVLLGILTADFYNDQAYRKRHRALFKLWNDPRVCSLPDFKALPLNERYRCELIYTFVMGGNPDAPPELVDDSRPALATKPVKGKSSDLNDPDVTLLNIRENMNEGKSQSWLKHGADIAEEYDLDYGTS